LDTHDAEAAVKEKPISTSIRASRDYIDAVRRVARRRDQKIADVVREGLDKLLGKELEQELKNFAPDGHKSVHTDNPVSEHVA
jgi:hypothetical protein